MNQLVKWLTVPAAAMLGIAAIMPAQAGARAGEERAATIARERRNFNADWLFHLGDAPGAQQAAYDDGAWQPVGLPHSFGIPYFQASQFYTGYGWYRKRLTVPEAWRGRRIALEFEGAFQDAEIFVNGSPVGRHRGGYTGFSIDISAAAKVGENVIAVRVNNLWEPALAPRAGEHVFQGGLYRDVWLVTTDQVHVPWYGTRATTPELSERSGRVALETEVRNVSTKAVSVSLRTEIRDPAGKIVAVMDGGARRLGAGGLATISQLSNPIVSPSLWSPETPVLYRAVTTVMANGRAVDRYETPFGFRWFEWTADRGFFLNGKHRYFKGANVHQDQAGWGDAVSNRAMERDVQMMKDAGFDFIRGSHYPHDPHFVEATDRIGMLFWSETPFWGIGGFGPDGSWMSSAYPVDPAHRAGFEESVKQQLTEMIRIARNHPSVIVWSMSNEPFFSAGEVMPEVRRFLKELVELSHRLDPTRPAAIGGAQRGEIDKLGDIAGYNGDGAALFPDPGIPNVVSEHGSPMFDRPGPYKAPWGDLVNTPGAEKGVDYSWRLPWRSGEAVWAGFDHGSIVGRRFGSMGIVDYARLPKRSYYWFRNAYRGVAPPEWPKPGKPAGLRLTSSSAAIERADGTDDVHLVVTVVDAEGRALSNSPPVTLSIESGPGELPTGRTIRFAPDSDIPIRDGQAAIAMRSWQSGKTVLRARSPGLKDAVLVIETTSGPAFVPGVTALAPDRPYTEAKRTDAEFLYFPDAVFGKDNPTGASSSAHGHSSRLVNDGDPGTWWIAKSDDDAPWVSISPEKILQFRRLEITFPQPGNYRFVAEVEGQNGNWAVVADQSATADTAQTRNIDVKRVVGSRLRVRIVAPAGAPAGVAEIRIIGAM
ncbi:glycoside hydrolase family 2 protein [Sphingopyxis indica]|uniref:F5/8 type C domain-containing protein n=1 Tax=Sphingopyxis indica TaxID=436663 RepID=A0A239JA46_9SPHN|nr:glycoside hydrolase family 2 TIM barrel-domain containing protein [Sphingopyxis indica]SNT02757.1 F5/8 type C domain-containing protein [Sphingopyxis indica]